MDNALLFLAAPTVMCFVLAGIHCYLGLHVLARGVIFVDLSLAQVAAIAQARGVPRAQVALAWVLQKNEVTAPIVGASKAGHLDDAVAALKLELTSDEIAALEAPYTPRSVAGFK